MSLISITRQFILVTFISNSISSQFLCLGPALFPQNRVTIADPLERQIIFLLAITGHFLGNLVKVSNSLINYFSLHRHLSLFNLLKHQLFLLDSLLALFRILHIRLLNQ
jgi:hypothetical protein